MAKIHDSIKGRRFGLGPKLQQIVNGSIEITRPCVGATVTVGDESTNVRAITIQLTDAYGRDIDYVEAVQILIVNSADLTTLAAPSPSTGLEAGTDGALMQVVADNLYIATSEADGDIDLTWTDTGTETAYIHVVLPNGTIVAGSQELTNA